MLRLGLAGTRAAGVVVACIGLSSDHAHAAALATDTLAIRGHEQVLHVYGGRGSRAAIVASGDGGWIHLGPDVAELLVKRGYCVVGFDSKAYLSSFTQGSKTLTTADVPGDFAALVDYASKGATERVLLVGVSEGAALAVLAAGDATLKPRLAGLIGFGLPDQAELAWRWRDAIIYVTKGVPKEPLFSTAEFVRNVAPLPFVAIHSTHDEFVPRADVERVMARAAEPKQLWWIDASNHRFSGKPQELEGRLVEAIQWIVEQRR